MLTVYMKVKDSYLKVMFNYYGKKAGDLIDKAKDYVKAGDYELAELSNRECNEYLDKRQKVLIKRLRMRGY